MTRFTLITACAMLLALTGCAGVRVTSLVEPDTKLQASSDSVCLLAGDLPAGTIFQLIGTIRATKGTYGGTDQLLPAIADQARTIGANAVINLQAHQRFRGPLPWRVTAPSGQGQAVRVTDPIDCAASGGKSL